MISVWGLINSVVCSTAVIVWQLIYFPLNEHVLNVVQSVLRIFALLPPAWSTAFCRQLEDFCFSENLRLHPACFHNWTAFVYIENIQTNKNTQYVPTSGMISQSTSTGPAGVKTVYSLYSVNTPSWDQQENTLWHLIIPQSVDKIMILVPWCVLKQL